MKAKKPSIKDVAELAGVSYATVSNVFTGKKRVNEDVQLRVREAARNLGYQVDKTASQLRSGSKTTVAVLVPNLADTFFAAIVSRLEKNAIDLGYDIIVASTHGRADVEESRLSALMSWRPAGMIIVPTTGAPPSVLNLPGFRVPTVLVDRVVSTGVPFDTVTLDNEKAGAQAGTFLKQKGHQRILVVASDLRFPPIAARLKGFQSAFTGGSYEIDVLEIGDEEEGSDALLARLQPSALPTAVFALNYMTTLKCLTAFSERQIVVGQDVSFIAFDDYAWMSARLIGLTAVRQPVDRIADEAWGLLMRRITGDQGEKTPASVVLPGTLIERGSVLELANQLETA